MGGSQLTALSKHCHNYTTIHIWNTTCCIHYRYTQYIYIYISLLTLQSYTHSNIHIKTQFIVNTAKSHKHTHTHNSLLILQSFTHIQTCLSKINSNQQKDYIIGNSLTHLPLVFIKYSHKLSISKHITYFYFKLRNLSAFKEKGK